LLLLLWVTFLTSAAAASTEFHERLLLVDINRQQLNQTVLLLEDNSGAIYVWSQDLQRWRFRPPEADTAIEYMGEQYFPISAVQDVSHVYDPKKLTLLIEVRPEAFTETTRSSQLKMMLPPVTPGPGGFINYDLFIAHATDSTQRSGQFELGFFNRYGVGIGNLFADNQGSSTRVTRLDTTWTSDSPEQLQTMCLGDATSSPGTWGRSLRFGGIQFKTNFGTQPGFVTSPPQSAVGQAALPSTVDVFINNALVSRQKVPPGPFTISNLPIVTGAGTVQLVVRDMFGREQLITQSFYASQSLLREGLESFSYELGFVRENFGINSNDYGALLGSGTYRRGLSDLFTGELHAEVMRDLATAGTGGDLMLPQLGTLSSYFAGSHSKSGSGSLALLGIERLSQPWSLGARTQWTSKGFTQIGLASQQSSPAQLSSANLSYATHNGGAVGIAYVKQLNRGQTDTRIGTLSYSFALGKIGTFSISALRNLAFDTHTTTLFAMFSMPLGASTNVSINAQSERGASAGKRDAYTTTLQRNLPGGEGYGYRLQARTDKNLEASYALQNNIGTYTLDAVHNQGSNATRFNASGGIALLGGDAFMSRRIGQSFAVARVADYPGVRVLVDNQAAGRTDAHGNVLIPRLRAYDINTISIDQRDLPLDAQIGTLKLDAIPYYRSGIDIRFPIRHANGATLSIRLENGKPLPVGALVQVVGKDETYVVGYGGEVYLVGLAATTRLRAKWREQSCEFEINYVTSADPLPDLGSFICKGVRP
jgi:outer membrane usher protein